MTFSLEDTAALELVLSLVTHILTLGSIIKKSYIYEEITGR